MYTCVAASRSFLKYPDVSSTMSFSINDLDAFLFGLATVK